MKFPHCELVTLKKLPNAYRCLLTKCQLHRIFFLKSSTLLALKNGSKIMQIASQEKKMHFYKIVAHHINLSPNYLNIYVLEELLSLNDDNQITVISLAARKR